MINFNKLHLTEGESLDAAASASEKAVAGGQKQREKTGQAREKQKAQMAAQTSVPMKSDVSYTSEEARIQRETEKMMYNNKSDWRQDLNEAMGKDDEGNHPFVDVMPAINQRQNEAKRQIKGAVKSGKGVQSDSQQSPDMAESASNPFQMHFDKDGKPYTSKGTKAERDRIAKNIAGNRKREPDPYRARPGESD